MTKTPDVIKPYVVDGGYVVEAGKKDDKYKVSGIVGDIINQAEEMFSKAENNGFVDKINHGKSDISSHIARIAPICVSLERASSGVVDKKDDYRFGHTDFELGLSEALYRLHVIIGSEVKSNGDGLLKFIDAQWFKNHIENYKNRSMGNYDFFKRSKARQYAVLWMYDRVARIIADYQRERPREAIMKMIELIVRIKLTGEKERCSDLMSIMLEYSENPSSSYKQ